MKIMDPILLSNLLPVFILLAFIIPFAYVTFRRKQKIKKDPVKSVGFMINVLHILFWFIFLANIFDIQKDQVFPFFILLLLISMAFVHTAFKHQKERIEALEEKLNAQNSQNLPPLPSR